MSDPVKKALRAIKGQRLPPLPPIPAYLLDLAETQAYNKRVQMWERDKKTKRDANFQKALLKLEEWREEQRREKARQQAIADERLENLKKARKALEKVRNNE